LAVHSLAILFPLAAGAQAPRVAPAPAGQVPVGDMVQKHQSSLVLFEGKNGAGSGFVAKGGGTDFIFSNIHVVASDRVMKLRNLPGTELKVGAAEVAVDHDVLRFRLAEGTANFATLELVTDFTGVKLNDPIVVLGNPEGQGVVTALEGKIRGIGPDRLEIDAEILPGNSGSPVIHRPSGKVIGIATYLTVQDSTFAENKGERKIRRFAYRIDSIKEWQPVNWQAFYAQADEVKRSRELTEGIYRLVYDIASGSNLDPVVHKSPVLKTYVRDFMTMVESKERISKSDVKATLTRMFESLKATCKGNVGPATANGYYDFFWDEFQGQKEIRQQMVNEFDDVIRKVERL
jgi:hypothetical protein